MDETHIVLDLDDTLIHAIFIDEATAKLIETDPKFNYLNDRSRIIRVVDIKDDDIFGNGVISTILVIFRPGLKEFINFILEYFDNVHIWSAGHKRYVRAIESLIFDPNHNIYKRQKIKVFTREDCNEITDKSVLKDLASKGFNLHKTLVVDDNDTTYVNNVENAIKIVGYNPNYSREHVCMEDNSLKDIIEWFLLNDVKNCRDVRKLDKSKIFKKRVI